MTTRGMNATTGEELAGLEHLRQSIRDILTTRKGTRVMLRDYGSELPALVDRPMNAELRVDIYAETALAIATWEPRLRLREVNIEAADTGKITLSMTADYLPEGKTVTLEGIIVGGAPKRMATTSVSGEWNDDAEWDDSAEWRD